MTTLNDSESGLRNRQSGHSTVDLGCGPTKRTEALGIDHYPYPGVDVVCDLDRMPWPIRADQFDTLYASHVIEHVQSIPDFMREIHRIARHGAIVHVVTPHFSSIDSWQDPTHRWHLSSEWYLPFCHADTYMTDQMPAFEPVSTEVSFSSSVRNIWPGMLRKLFGLRAWERRHAFRYPGKNISTRLRVIKQDVP